jgi:Undecaprenyl-phosphate galactose phosphotransferase WbaP
MGSISKAVRETHLVRPEPVLRPGAVLKLDARCRPVLSSALIAAADLCAFTAASLTCVVLRKFLGGKLEFATYIHLWPVFSVVLGVFALFGLYPGIVANPVTEIRRIVEATTVVFLTLTVVTFLVRTAEAYSRLVFFVAWLLAMLLIPLARAAVRKGFARKDWWGYPAVVFGAGDTGRMVIQQLQSQPELGFRVKVVADPSAHGPSSLYGLPVFCDLETTAAAARRAGVSHAIIAMPELSSAKLLALLESHVAEFPNVLLVPDLGGISSLGIETRDLCRQLALEVRRSLLRPGAQLAKRCLDVSLASLVSLAALPVFAIIYVLLKVESRGEAFYSQPRIGRHGDVFRIWKFRTMVPNAQQLLDAYLETHPQLRYEWERDQKLKNDPRVTPLGRILRRFSLDELPQLWNVFSGDMSLVGPRPIIQNEVAKYGEGYVLYRQVLPGVTGLWQISGRNNTSYPERIALDSYYVRNWSPWFDIYILSRTIKVVLGCEGAY